MSATRDDILRALQAADAAGNTEDAKQLAQMWQDFGQAVSQAEVDFPTVAKPSISEEILYEIEEANTIPENFGDWVESYLPLGRISTDGYLSPEEAYGKGFMAASPEERRRMIQEAKIADLESRYPEVIQARKNNEKAAAAYAGDFIGFIADPTILVGAGVQSVKGIAGLSGLFGATYSISEDLTTPEAEIDLAKLGITTTIGTVAGAGAGKLGQMYSKRRKAKVEAKELEFNNNVVDQINFLQARLVSEGVPKAQILDQVKTVLNLTDDQLDEVLSKSDINVVMPKTKEDADRQILYLREKQIQAANAETKIGGIMHDLAVPMLSRMQNLDKKFAFELDRFEFLRHGSLYKYFSKKTDKPLVGKDGVKDYDSVGDFLATFSKFSKRDKDLFTMYTSNLTKANQEKLTRLYRKYSDDISELNSVYKAINRLGKGLQKQAGYKIPLIQKYMPRLVKDYKGLEAHLNKTYDGIVTKASAIYRKEQEELQKRSVTNVVLTDDLLTDEKNFILDAIAANDLRSLSPRTQSFLKKRNIQEITEDIMPFYETADVALTRYITRSIDDIHFAGLMGKENIVYTNAGQKAIDLEATIKNSLANNPRMSERAQLEAKELLMSRFTTGQQAPHKIIRGIRDSGYLFTLANFYSALTQLGDIGLSAWINGFIPTIRAVIKRDFDMKEFGLENYISAIATNPRDMSSWLNKAFNLSGFSKLDRVGKNIYMNAAWLRLQKNARSEKGKRKIARQYKEVFGDEYDLFVKDLENGNISENVRMAIWSELSEVQPLSLSKMPKTALDMPNGRIFYMLKHYGLNQLNFMYKQTIQKMKSGDAEVKREGLKNLLTGAVILPMMGASVLETKAWIKSGFYDFDEEKLPLRAGDYALRMFGLSAYTLDKVKRTGNPADALIDYALPPTSMYQNLIMGAAEAVDGNYGLDNPLVKNLPVVYPLLPFVLGDPAAVAQVEANRVTNAGR